MRCFRATERRITRLTVESDAKTNTAGKKRVPRIRRGLIHSANNLIIVVKVVSESSPQPPSPVCFAPHRDF
jgi:hypothetical protein